MILGSVSSKFSAQILPRTVTSVCGPHWWSGGGGLATARVTNTGERKAGHRLLSNVSDSENRPARFSIFSRNISSFDHAESNSVVNACQQSCHSISLIQANRYTTQSPGADGEVKSNPSPHFKTRKNLAEKSGKASTEDIQAKDVRPGSHDYLLPHPIWSEEELDAVQITHNPPKEKVDKVCFHSLYSSSVSSKFFGPDFAADCDFGLRSTHWWVAEEDWRPLGSQTPVNGKPDISPAVQCVRLRE
nr:uncharacterized protein LOC129255751 [Lytechinus pictus]